MSRRRRVALWTLSVGVLLTVLSLFWAMRADNIAGTVLGLASRALDLEISAAGAAEYRLGGTPQLVLRDVSAGVPGARTPLLRADRILIAVPWSTLRARGGDLTATRIELDAPVLDLAALQDWLARRPPGDAPLPALTRGLVVNNGTVIGETWSVRDLDMALPSFAADAAVRAQLRGRYAGSGISAPFDLHLAMTRPAADAGLGVAGEIAPQASGWRLPSRIRLSAFLRNGDTLRLDRAVLGSHSRYVAGATELPFDIGIAGALQSGDDGTLLQPLGVAVRGTGPVPTLDAEGTLLLADTLRLDLQGALPSWPEAWPALPPPLHRPDAPFDFALDYAGASDLSDAVALQLRRGDGAFDGRLRMPEVLAWADQGKSGSPLPPITGRVTAARVEISGAILEGVEVDLLDPGVPAGDSPR